MSGSRCKALRANFKAQFGRPVQLTFWERKNREVRTWLGTRVMPVPVGYRRGEWRTVKTAFLRGLTPAGLIASRKAVTA